MEGTVVYVNPSAGSGRGLAVWGRLQRLEPALASARVMTVPGLEAARARLTELLETGTVRRLLVVGGDGTLSQAVDVLLGADLGTDIDLGLIPAGTGSDLARGLGLSRRPRRSLPRVLAASPRPLDALRLDTADGRRRYLVNTFSAGLSGLAAATVNAMPRRGLTAFLRGSLHAIRHYQPRPCRLSVDGEPWFEGPLHLLVAANGRFFGRGMKVAPPARPDDGRVTMLTLAPVGRLRLALNLLPRVFLGAHLGDEAVRWCQGRALTLELLEEMPPFEVDGELMPSADLRLTVLPGALRFLA